jgi:DNA relaxase NicK
MLLYSGICTVNNTRKFTTTYAVSTQVGATSHIQTTVLKNQVEPKFNFIKTQISLHSQECLKIIIKHLSATDTDVSAFIWRNFKTHEDKTAHTDTCLTTARKHRV